MNNDYDVKRRNGSLITLLALFPLLMPILDPYALTEGGGLMICDIVVIVLILYMILNKSIIVHKSLLLLLIIDFFLTLFSMIFTYSQNTSLFVALKVGIVFGLYLIAYSSIWAFDIRSAYLRFAEIVGLICAVLAILQFVFASLGYNFYDGRLFLPLGEGSYFGGLFDRNTNDLRVHSFFEEPSYLGIYELPITVYLIQEKKYLKGIICAVSCIISGSMIGVAGLIICLTALLLMDSSIEKGTKLRIIGLMIVAAIVLIYIYNTNVSFKTLIDYYITRSTSLQTSMKRSDSSFSQRIMGNIVLFDEYKNLNKLIGVGFNQYSLYFGLFKDYSNDIVSNLLNFGYVGIIALACSFISIFKHATSHGRIFFLILVMVLCVDHSWFGAMFFYLLTWVLANSDSDHQKSSFIGVRY